jgi:hypothetical protein
VGASAAPLHRLVLAELTSLIWSNLETIVPLIGFVGVAIAIRIRADVPAARRMTREG